MGSMSPTQQCLTPLSPGVGIIAALHWATQVGEKKNNNSTAVSTYCGKYLKRIHFDSYKSFLEVEALAYGRTFKLSE